MKLIVMLLLAVAAFGQKPEPKFEVQKLTPAEVESLEKANKVLDAAAEQLRLAQDEAEKAQAARDAVIRQITARFAVMEGVCSYPGNGPGIYYQSSKPYRRVEIRGRYALITSGSESCGGWGIVQNTLTLPLAH